VAGNLADELRAELLRWQGLDNLCEMYEHASEQVGREPGDQKPLPMHLRPSPDEVRALVADLERDPTWRTPDARAVLAQWIADAEETNTTEER